MLRIHHLLTENRENPVGLDTHPRLSWEIVSDKRNCLQTAYRIVCGEDPAAPGQEQRILWDSDVVKSDASSLISYEGNDLQSGQIVSWKVQVWDNHGNVSEWSESSFWQMGLLSNDEWKGRWIAPPIDGDNNESTPCPYLRKEFYAAGDIQQATAFVTARGLYELRINGNKVGDELFTPGWTSYHHRLQYQVYDVTKDLEGGNNALGVILGDGWYRGYLGWQGERNFYGDELALLLQLKIVYQDGSTEYICSDPSWKFSTGPILKSDLYRGETYDARLENPGWDKAGSDETNWEKVKVRDHDFKNIVCSLGVPVKQTQQIVPVEKIITPKGETVFDLGQNIVGRVKFTLQGKKGEKIVLNHAEVLDQDGNFYTDNLRAAIAEDVYYFKGEGIEEYEPRFTFHGFRYIRISGDKVEAALRDFHGIVIHSDVRPTGNFECSDPMVNQLQKNIQWGLFGNFLDVPSDCPQRDERMGWTGDAQVFAPTACFNVNAYSFFRKWLKDLACDQRSDGSVPWVVPNVVKNGGGTGWSDGFGATGWADAALVIPWTLYQVYGDTQILEEQYSSMKGWVEYMINESGERCIFNTGFHFGDWLSFAEYYSYHYNAPDYGYAGAHTEKELIATAYFYFSTMLLQKVSGILGKKEDRARYTTLLPAIKASFQREFITDSGRLVSATQTAYALSLSFGLIPDELTEVVAKRLADDVEHFGHLTTGFLGTPLLCQVLTDYNYQDIAAKLLLNKRYPSWLYPLTKGATTIWERWDGIKPDGTFQDVGMNSFNHYAYGAVGQWLYSSVAGIQTDPAHPGYKKIRIAPVMIEGLSHAKASYRSVYGDICVAWEKAETEMVIRIRIPANTSALISLPCTDKAFLKEGELHISQIDELCVIEEGKARTTLEAGSGEYTFSFPVSCYEP